MIEFRRLPRYLHVTGVTLTPGFRFVDPGCYHPDGVDVPCEVVTAGEPWEDRFGRTMTRWWCKRLDTGHEGWKIMGPAGVVCVPLATKLRTKGE